MIARFKKVGAELCTKTLSEEYGLDRKTIQNDLKFLRNYFGEDVLIQTKRGCYKLNTAESFVETITQSKNDSQELRELIKFIALFDENILEKFDVEKFPLLEKIKKDQQELYHIHGHPIEKLNSPYMTQIKKAVGNRRYVKIIYNGTWGIQTYIRQKVMRIVFAEGNWYLATLDDMDVFSFLRISRIESFDILSTSFHRDLEADQFIKNFQSLFSQYGQTTQKIKLKVHKKKAYFFKMKHFLTSQRIVDDLPDGSLLLEFDVTNYMEIKRIIYQWIPYVTVVEPESLRRQILKEVEFFTKKLK